MKMPPKIMEFIRKKTPKNFEQLMLHLKILSQAFTKSRGIITVRFEGVFNESYPNIGAFLKVFSKLLKKASSEVSEAAYKVF